MSDRETRRQAGRLSGQRERGERRPGLRAAGAAASRIAAPVVARHGGAGVGRLKAQWGAIVGAELAALTWPEALGRDGALKLRVAAAFALELQHRAPLVIERINLYFGRAAVARLALVQAPLPLPAPRHRPAPARLGAAAAAALDARLGTIAEPALREALTGLGRLVLAAERDRG